PASATTATELMTHDTRLIRPLTDISIPSWQLASGLVLASSREPARITLGRRSTASVPSIPRGYIRRSANVSGAVQYPRDGDGATRSGAQRCRVVRAPCTQLRGPCR